jgi:hypothetical protein
MKKIFKLAHSHEIYLYPTPVDKKQTFLIKVESLFEGKLLKHLLDPGYLDDPLLTPDLYEPMGFHADQRTPVYQVLWEKLQLHFLPQRELDIKRAQAIEELLTKKIIALKKNPKAELIDEIIFRFQKQKECSECAKLGINSVELDEWFARFKDFLGAS